MRRCRRPGRMRAPSARRRRVSRRVSSLCVYGLLMTIVTWPVLTAGGSPPVACETVFCVVGGADPPPPPDPPLLLPPLCDVLFWALFVAVGFTSATTLARTEVVVTATVLPLAAA